jgi:glycerol-3-phosphate dehydrogenase
MPGDTALIIPRTNDGRVLFLVPWHRHLLLGTTDNAVAKPLLEPKPMEEEIDYLLAHAVRYLARPPKKEDILSAFAGLRPLIQAQGKSTASLSRDHALFISDSGLITITGGKWTTYRKMAEDVVDKAAQLARLKDSPCRTKHLPLHGYVEKKHALDSWLMYGTDASELEKLTDAHPDWKQLLHPRLPYLPVEIVWAARREMARTLEDVLARRTRALFLDVAAALEIAPRAARLLAHELGKDETWEKEQLAQFKELAKRYRPS